MKNRIVEDVVLHPLVIKERDVADHMLTRRIKNWHAEIAHPVGAAFGCKHLIDRSGIKAHLFALDRVITGLAGQVVFDVFDQAGGAPARQGAYACRRMVQALGDEYILEF